MSGQLQTILDWALSQRGKPYVYGATGPSAYDCSGLTQKAFAAAGIRLPRTSQEQRNAGTEVPLSQIQPGDLVTFTYSDGPGNPGPGNHVALYYGHGQVIEAARPGVPVRVAPLDVSHIDRVRRILGSSASTGATPADDISGTTVTTAGLQQAGYDAVINLTPWGIPLNPFKLPGWLAGKLGDAAGGALGSAGGALWDSAGPVLLASIGVAAGVALAVLGVYATAKPTIDQTRQEISQLAPSL